MTYLTDGSFPLSEPINHPLLVIPQFLPLKKQMMREIPVLNPMSTKQVSADINDIPVSNAFNYIFSQYLVVQSLQSPHMEVSQKIGVPRNDPNFFPWGFPRVFPCFCRFLNHPAIELPPWRHGPEAPGHHHCNEVAEAQAIGASDAQQGPGDGIPMDPTRPLR